MEIATTSEAMRRAAKPIVAASQLAECSPGGDRWHCRRRGDLAAVDQGIGEELRAAGSMPGFGEGAEVIEGWRLAIP